MAPSWMAAGGFPTGEAREQLTGWRRRVGRIWRVALNAATAFGLIVLSALMYNVVNSAFGYALLRDSYSAEWLVLQERAHVQVAASRYEAQAILAAEPHRLALLPSPLIADVPVEGQTLTIPLPGHEETLSVLAAAAPENEILRQLDAEALAQGLLTGGAWTDVDPALPDAPVAFALVQDDEGVLDAWLGTLDLPALSSLDKAQLTAILENNVSTGLMRRFERDEPFAQRSAADVLALIRARVIEPRVVATFSLVDSLFRRAAVEAEARAQLADMEFKAWLTGDFIANAQSSRPLVTGIRTALLGSLWVIAVTVLFSVPLGIGAAIYLEEYSSRNRFERIIETNINNLAGVPSIIYGMLGLAIFVRALNTLTSGALFGAVPAQEANGRTIVSAGLTLGLLILPIIIINGQEALRAVPFSLREASYGVGATQWQTVRHHVLAAAAPGIFTGTILAVSRALGETAPLVVIGAATFISTDPNGIFAKFTVLPIQIYQWTARPQMEFRHIAAAAIIVLLAVLLAVNAAAVWLRQRFSRQRI